MTRLRGLVDVQRDALTPPEMAEIVDHYSIPALDATGFPERVESSKIDSHKLSLRGGEVLVSRLNPRKPRVHIVPSRLTAPSVASTEFVSLQPRSIETRFLRYVLLSEQTRQLLDSQARSATRSHQRVEPSAILELAVRVAKKQEQRRIADFLDDRLARIDQIIEARRKQVGLVSLSYRAWLHEFIIALEATYGCAPLRRFGVHIEQGWSPAAESAPAQVGQAGVLKLGAVRDGQFKPEENKAMLPETKPRPEYLVRPGDLLVTRANTPTLVGDAAVSLGDWESDLYLSDLIYRLHLDDYDVSLASAALRSPSARQTIGVVARGTSGSMPKLRGDDLISLPMPSVPLNRQKAHGARDHEERLMRDRRMQELERSIDLFNEYKQSLITAAVTGELDVTTAGSGIPRT